MKKNVQTQLDYLAKCSPLELPNKLLDLELYDQKSSQELLDDIYNDFESGSYRQQDIVDPIFLSIASSVLELKMFQSISKKVGLTSQRIVSECHSFSYSSALESTNVFGIDASKRDTNLEEYQRKSFEEYAEEHRSKYVRSQYEDKNAMTAYKEKRIEENGDRVNLMDEYSRTWDMTGHYDTADNRRNDPKHEHNAETDHIIPLEKQFEYFKGNYALSDSDIKKIANDDSNFALTKRSINNPKRDLEPEVYVEGRGSGLSDSTKQNILKKARDARESRDEIANRVILKNMLGGNKEVKSKDIFKKNAENACKSTGMAALGEVVLLIIKPLYFEISEMFIKGDLTSGTGKNSVKEAIQFRLSRVKEYVWSKITSMKELLGNLKDLLKTMLNAFIEGLINMFLGVFKQALKLVKQGVQLGYQAFKILFGKDSKTKTAAEKGDAIIKLIGASVMSFCAIGIEALLEKIGCPEWLGGPLAVLLSGIGSALFLYLIDKADLFSVKSEKRSARVKEIFEARINEIKEAQRTAETQVLQILKEQRLLIISANEAIKSSLEAKDYNLLNKSIFEMADFLGVKLSFKSVDDAMRGLDTGKLTSSDKW